MLKLNVIELVYSIKYNAQNLLSMQVHFVCKIDFLTFLNFMLLSSIVGD